MFTLTNLQFKQLRSHLDAIQSILNSTCQQETNLLCDSSFLFPSRPITKSELARLLNKSTRQLSRWIEPFRPQLREMGVSDTAKVLPPDAVAFICRELDITFDEKTL